MHLEGTTVNEDETRRNDGGLTRDDWIRTGQTFDYSDDSDGDNQTEMWETDVCPCGASSSDRCRFAPSPVNLSDDWEDVQPIQPDDWYDPPDVGADYLRESDQTDEPDDRTEFIDEYLRGKAMDDMIGVVATLVVFLTITHGIELDE